jgi:hypothetical protein
MLGVVHEAYPEARSPIISSVEIAIVNIHHHGTMEVRRLSGHPPEERCQTLSADIFFGELGDVEGFPALYETLKETLTDLKVYRCGAANLTVYVVGRDAHGRLAGFKTRAVET